MEFDHAKVFPLQVPIHDPNGIRLHDRTCGLCVTESKNIIYEKKLQKFEKAHEVIDLDLRIY